MEQRGPKKLSVAQLRARGSRSSVVKARQAEEARARVSLLPRAAAAVVEIPAGLTDPSAIALYRHVATQYRLEPIGESVLVQACCALQRAEQCRVKIDQDGQVNYDGPKPTAHPLLSAERDARALYLRLIDKLGLLD